MKTHFPGQVTHFIYNHEQLEVLSSVACNDVYTSLSPIEAMSIREVAAELGKSAASVGEQLNKLLEVNLAISTGSRKRRSRTELLYAMSSMSASVSIDDLSEEDIVLINKQFRGNMRASERLLTKYLEARNIDNSFRLFGYHTLYSAYLSPENSLKIREAMLNLHDLLRQLNEKDPEKRSDGTHVRIKLTTMMFPTISESKKVINKDS